MTVKKLGSILLLMNLEVAKCDLKIVQLAGSLILRSQNATQRKHNFFRRFGGAKEMTKAKSLVPVERIERSIFMIRGQKVLIDAELAKLYGTTTKRLNEQVRRNIERFPEDFMFQMTDDEFIRLKEQSAVVEVSIFVVRAFIRLRERYEKHEDIARKLDALEKKYAIQFSAVFDAIRQLMAPPKPKKNQVGFHWEDSSMKMKKAPVKNKAPAKKKPVKKSAPAKKNK